MKSQDIHCGKAIPTLLVVLLIGCFSSSLKAQANASNASGPSIVGLWNVRYIEQGSLIFQSYDQWHSDGLEFEVANVRPGVVCQGTWEAFGHGAKLLHVGYLFDKNSGQETYYYVETQTNRVSNDGKTYEGVFDTKYYDTNGNLVDEETGQVHATRLSVP
jgi:hypothetical protein